MNKAKAMNNANKRKAGLRDGEISTEKKNFVTIEVTDVN